MPTAYSYIRFSSPEQAKGTSEDRQVDYAAKWCAENPGYFLEALKPDRGRSGFHGRHIQNGHLGIFLDMARTGIIQRGSVLIVEQMDRLSRQDPYTAMGTLREIIDAGIDVVVIGTGKRYNREVLATDPIAMMEIQFTLFQGHGESLKKSKRLKYVWETKREKAKTGEKVTARRPAWIKRDGTVDEVKADIIRRLYREALEGKGSRAIVSIFNRENVPTLKGAKAWTTGNIDYYLRTPTVIGTLLMSRIIGTKYTAEQEVEGYYPPIIDDETWGRVKAIVNARRKLYHSKMTTEVTDPATGKVTAKPKRKFKQRTDVEGRSRLDNLFVRLLYSLYDGGGYAFTQASKDGIVDGKPVTWITRRLRNNRTRNSLESIPFLLDYPSFEQAFFRFVREVDPVGLFRPEDRTRQAVELASLEGQLTDLDERIEDATASYKRADRATRQRWASILDEVENERQTCLTRLETLRSELTTSEARVFSDILDCLDDPDARYKVASSLRMIVERIEVLPIHTGNGPHRVAEYLLYVEVKFTNGQVRVFVTDHRGTAVATKTGGALVGYSVTTNEAPAHLVLRRVEKVPVETSVREAFALWTDPGKRRAILAELIEQASSEWKPKLSKWLESL